MDSKKKGISIVLTTLILVVASVVLASSLAMFGTSLFQRGAHHQAMALTNTHLWFNANSSPSSPQVEGAIVVRNTGDNMIGVDSIKVRGAMVPFGNWGVSATSVTPTQTQAQFVYLDNIPPGINSSYDIDGPNGSAPTVTLLPNAGPVSLDAGDSVIIYFSVPGGVITSADLGFSASTAVSAGQIGLVQTVLVTGA